MKVVIDACAGLFIASELFVVLLIVSELVRTAFAARKSRSMIHSLEALLETAACSSLKGLNP